MRYLREAASLAKAVEARPIVSISPTTASASSRIVAIFAAMSAVARVVRDEDQFTPLNVPE